MMHNIQDIKELISPYLRNARYIQVDSLDSRIAEDIGQLTLNHMHN